MSRKVLIIIDVQNGFVNKATQYAVDNLGKLLEKEHFDVVVQSRWENYMGSQYEKRLDYQAVGNSYEAELVFPSYADHVITRTCYSCWGPKLEAILQPDDDIYVVGLETDACVMGTLFSLWDHEYRFHVYEKCVATGRKDLQKPALEMIRRQFGKECLI